MPDAAVGAIAVVTLLPSIVGARGTNPGGDEHEPERSRKTESLKGVGVHNRYCHTIVWQS